jgi:hypothetical protein
MTDALIFFKTIFSIFINSAVGSTPTRQRCLATEALHFPGNGLPRLEIIYLMTIQQHLGTTLKNFFAVMGKTGTIG